MIIGVNVIIFWIPSKVDHVQRCVATSDKILWMNACTVDVLFIDYVQRSSSSLYRRLRYKNCLNYITYITLHVAIAARERHCCE